MKIILFRFEKDKMHFLECVINSGNLVLGDKEKVSFEASNCRGEKYSKILVKLLKIQAKYSANYFAYQSPQKYRGAIKDEEGFANSSILNLFCYQNDLKLLELTPVIVREKIAIPSKDFKELLEQTKNEIIQNYSITKSDKLIDGLVFLYTIKNHF